MSQSSNDATRLRIQDTTLVDSLSQIDRDPALGMPCLVARTKLLSSYPSLAQQFFACSPVTILGVEVEGGSGILDPGSSTFFALNLGSAIPPIGTNILATFVDNRWVFRFDS